MANLELFNQQLKTTLADTDRIAIGIPGMTGCFNVTISDFKRNFGLTKIYKGTSASSVNITIPANSIILFFVIVNKTSTTNNITFATNNSDLLLFDTTIEASKSFVDVKNIYVTMPTSLSITAIGNIDFVCYVIENIF